MSDETQAARVDESPRLDEDLIGYAIWPVGIALGFAGWSRGWSFSSVSFILFQWTIVPLFCVGFAKMLRGKASINSNLAVFLWEKTKLYFIKI